MRETFDAGKDLAVGQPRNYEEKLERRNARTLTAKNALKRLCIERMSSAGKCGWDSASLLAVLLQARLLACTHLSHYPKPKEQAGSQKQQYYHWYGIPHIEAHKAISGCRCYRQPWVHCCDRTEPSRVHTLQLDRAALLAQTFALRYGVLLGRASSQARVRRPIAPALAALALRGSGSTRAVAASPWRWMLALQRFHVGR